MRATFPILLLLVTIGSPAAGQSPAARAKAVTSPATGKAPASPAPAAQTPAAPKPAAPAQAADVPVLEPKDAAATAANGGAPLVPAPAQAYVYEPAGRRDPFLNLVGAGADTSGEPGARPDGAAGLMVNEISVRGIVRSRGALVAAVQGPDNRTYVIRRGDKLLDGTVKAVTEEGLTIVQDVNDPLSIVKQREVQRLLRSLEDAK